MLGKEFDVLCFPFSYDLLFFFGWLEDDLRVANWENHLDLVQQIVLHYLPVLGGFFSSSLAPEARTSAASNRPHFFTKAWGLTPGGSG